LLGESELGPFFIDGNLTTQKYENMLRDEIVPTIQTIVGPKQFLMMFGSNKMGHRGLTTL